jgi:hypothetical protein
MWRGTRSFFCIDPKEPYLHQTEGRGLWRFLLLRLPLFTEVPRRQIPRSTSL